MVGGRLQAVGSQLRLKAKYGDGYTLTTSLAHPAGQLGAASAAGGAMDAAAARAFAYIRTVVPGAALVSRVGSTATFLLPRVDAATGAPLDVAAVFAALEGGAGGSGSSGKAAAGIAEWGITQSSLDEVFVRVVQAAEAAAAADKAAATAAAAASAGVMVLGDALA